MKKIPKSLLSVITMLLHMVVLPIFFLGFILLYKSQWMVRFIAAGSDSPVFNTLMLTCILIGVLFLSRVTMTVFRHKLPLSWWQYALWTLTELFVFCDFAALYMALIYGEIGYFPALGQCMRLVFMILPYGYTIIALLMAVIRPDEEQINEEELIRFSDSTGRLKLVIARDVLLYIEAQENYVIIHYLEGEQQKLYSLRQSMRGIEELMQRRGIIRCQRSYFINPKHVKVLRRDKEGFIQAELDVRDGKAVPVSPKYYEQLSHML